MEAVKKLIAFLNQKTGSNIKFDAIEAVAKDKLNRLLDNAKIGMFFLFLSQEYKNSLKSAGQESFNQFLREAYDLTINKDLQLVENELKKLWKKNKLDKHFASIKPTQEESDTLEDGSTNKDFINSGSEGSLNNPFQTKVSTSENSSDIELVDMKKPNYSEVEWPNIEKDFYTLTDQATEKDPYLMNDSLLSLECGAPQAKTIGNDKALPIDELLEEARSKDAAAKYVFYRAHPDLVAWLMQSTDKSNSYHQEQKAFIENNLNPKLTNSVLKFNKRASLYPKMRNIDYSLECAFISKQKFENKAIDFESITKKKFVDIKNATSCAYDTNKELQVLKYKDNYFTESFGANTQKYELLNNPKSELAKFQTVDIMVAQMLENLPSGRPNKEHPIVLRGADTTLISIAIAALNERGIKDKFIKSYPNNSDSTQQLTKTKFTKEFAKETGGHAYNKAADCKKFAQLKRRFTKEFKNKLHETEEKSSYQVNKPFK